LDPNQPLKAPDSGIRWLLNPCAVDERRLHRPQRPFSASWAFAGGAASSRAVIPSAAAVQVTERLNGKLRSRVRIGAGVARHSRPDDVRMAGRWSTAASARPQFERPQRPSRLHRCRLGMAVLRCVTSKICDDAIVGRGRRAPGPNKTIIRGISAASTRDTRPWREAAISRVVASALP
jgi:hypothetical protein